jgi:hypothetical protein
MTTLSDRLRDFANRLETLEYRLLHYQPLESDDFYALRVSMGSMREAADALSVAEPSYEAAHAVATPSGTNQ